jgi:hypothetical protein
VPVIQVLYYTDPACPWSWALEPSLRKLQCVFGESLRFTYVMCGMAREFSVKAVAEQWDPSAYLRRVRDRLQCRRRKLDRCELPGPRAPAELWRLASGWRLRGERLGSVELWSPA